MAAPEIAVNKGISFKLARPFLDSNQIGIVIAGHETRGFVNVDSPNGYVNAKFSSNDYAALPFLFLIVIPTLSATVR